MVLGASFGGIGAALTVKALLSNAEIVLLDKAPFFRSAPGALGYLFGMLPLAVITRGYDALATKGMPVIRAEVLGLDPGKKRVVSSRGTLDYDYLVIATGVRLAYEEVPGLAERADVNSSFYETGAPLPELRRRIRAFRGGRVVVSTPTGAYTCLPAPYEYALLWAAHMKTKRLKGTVTMLDPRPKPTPPALARGMLQAMEAYRDVLVYEPYTQLLSVDADARTVESDAGKLGFEILSVVPPSATMGFITDAGLGDPFIEVDPKSFVTANDSAIYALGDTAGTPYAKTASATISSARIAGRHIAQAMGEKIGGGRGSAEPVAPESICFPHVSPEEALMLKVEWSYARNESGELQVKAHGTTDTEAKAAHLRARRRWEAMVIREMFGR